MFNGIFGDMFDFNGNGKLDPSEQAMEFMFLDSIMNSEDDSEDENNSDGDI